MPLNTNLSSHVFMWQNFPKNKPFLTPDTPTYICVSEGNKRFFFGIFCKRTKSMILYSQRQLDKIKRKFNTRIYNLSSGTLLPVFRQLLLRNGNISSKCLIWNEWTQQTDGKWQQESYFTSTLINFSIIYFQTGNIIELNYYQWPN